MESEIPIETKKGKSKTPKKAKESILKQSMCLFMYYELSCMSVCMNGLIHGYICIVDA